MTVSTFRGPHEVIVNLRPGTATFCFDRTRVYVIDGAGRFVSAVDGDLFIRRSLANVFYRKRGARPLEVVESDFAAAFLESVRTELSGFVIDVGEMKYGVSDGDPIEEIRSSVAGACRFGPQRLADDGNRFKQIYGNVPILPPDQALALYVQGSIGCPYRGCAFCTFYSDTRYRIRSVDDFGNHVEEVRGFFGSALALRRTIFLGEANAGAIPIDRLVGFLEILGSAFSVRPRRHSLAAWRMENPTGFDGVYAFGEPFTVVDRPADEWDDLAIRGLRRVYLGVETGSEPLRVSLRKRGHGGTCREAVERLHEGGIDAGVMLLVGAADDEHVTATADLVGSMGLRRGDIVYLSPLRPVQVPEQESALLQALRAACRDVPVARYDIDRFIY
jgi:radical SAM superfamily enzyme YgiQ (UPF0313 family)